jgi:RNase P/RNase MRP subunit p30
MATYEDFTIDQGSDLALQIELVEPDGSIKNLNGYTVSAKMKKTFRSTAADTVEFTSIVADPAESGVATISLTNTQTDALSSRGRYVYDVELSYIGADGETIVERVLEGKIKVNPSVTR